MTETPHVVRIFQTADAAGAPVAQEYAQTIERVGLVSIVETTIEFLTPLQPRPTEHQGVYWYTDPGRGSGWLRLEGYTSTQFETTDGLVRTADLSCSIGKEDPRRPDELGDARLVVPRTTNPFFQLATGIVVVIMALACFGTAVFRDLATSGVVAVVIVGVGLLGVGVWAISVGARRRAWWVAARAEAARRGEPLPEQLRFWN